MNILGLDYGEKRIGLALADQKMKIATPYKILENKGVDFVISELKKICAEEKIDEIVVGLPVSLKGEIEVQAEKVLEFVKLLKENLEASIKTEDERFTSVMVDKLAKELKAKSAEAYPPSRRDRRKTLRRRIERDAVAAMLILQSYLDRIV